MDHSGPENRRDFLRVLGGAVAFTSFGQAFGQSQPRTPTTRAAPRDLLPLAATAEALTVTLYHHALTEARFQLQADAHAQLAYVLQAEQSHLDLLAALGGEPLHRSFNLPADLTWDARCFAETALHLEQVCAGAYLAATHQFAALGQPELAATAAQLGASESQHLVLLSHLAGLGPREVTLPPVSFRRLNDAAPTFAAFVGTPAHAQVAVPLPTPRQVAAFGPVTRSAPAFAARMG